VTIRVLLVDDVDDMRALVRAQLGFGPDLQVVGEASNGEEAVNASRSMRPDVIVLDVEMPVMDGIQALPLLRQRWPDSKVIVYSASVGRRPEAMEAGADLFVEKVDVLDLTESICSLSATR
jgi:two-component system secretion response regulator SsrB